MTITSAYLNMYQSAPPEFLMEDRVDFLKNQYKDKLSSDFDYTGKHKDSDAIIDHLANKFDPTPNKIHTGWLINQYRNQQFHQDDHPTVKKDLQNFDKVKKNLEKKDINQYSSLTELRDAVAPQLHVAKVKDKETALSNENKNSGIEKIFDEDGCQGFKLKTKEASIDNYGPGGKMGSTRWCTAARSSSNMFSSYKGGKYTLHLPNGEFLQAHHSSGQMMDPDNVSINLKTNPKYSGHADTIRKFIGHTHELEGKPESKLVERYSAVKPEDVEAGIKEYEDIPSTETYKITKHNLKHIAENGELSHDQFNRILAVGDKLNPKFASSNGGKIEPTDLHHQLAANTSLSEDQQMHLTKHPTASYTLSTNKAIGPKVIDHLLEISKDDPDRISINELAKHPQLSEPQIREIHSRGGNVLKNPHVHIPEDIQHEGYDSLEKLHRDPKLNLSRRSDLYPSVVKKFTDDLFQKVGGTSILDSNQHLGKVIENNELDHSQIHDILKSKYANPEKLLVNQPNLTGEQADSIVSGRIEAGKAKVFTPEHKLTAQHLHQIIDSPEHSPEIYKHKGIDSTHMSKIINLSNEPQEFVNHKGFKKEHLDLLLNKIHTMGDSVPKLLESKHITPEHLHSVIDNPSVSRYVKMGILNHPKAQSSHFEKVASDPRYHGMISSSKMAPPSILASLANSEFPHVRENVMKNKNTPKDVVNSMKGNQ